MVCLCDTADKEEEDGRRGQSSGRDTEPKTVASRKDVGKNMFVRLAPHYRDTATSKYLNFGFDWCKR